MEHLPATRSDTGVRRIPSACRLSATSASSAVQILYDGDGNRVRKTVGGITIWFLVDDRNPTGYAQVMEELSDATGVVAVDRAYAHGLDLISQSRITNNEEPITSFYGYDGHGNVRSLTDETGNVTDTYVYDAFGALLERHPDSSEVGTATPNNYLYCGEQYDPDLGLYFLRARYMDTTRGRFWTVDVWEGMNEDPIGLNKYVYGNGSPVTYVDPTGHVGLFGEMIAMTILGMMQSTPMPAVAGRLCALSAVCRRARVAPGWMPYFGSRMHCALHVRTCSGDLLEYDYHSTSYHGPGLAYASLRMRGAWATVSPPAPTSSGSTTVQPLASRCCRAGQPDPCVAMVNEAAARVHPGTWVVGGATSNTPLQNHITQMGFFVSLPPQAIGAGSSP